MWAADAEGVLRDKAIECALRDDGVAILAQHMKRASTTHNIEKMELVIQFECEDKYIRCNACGMPRLDCPVGAKTQKELAKILEPKKVSDRMNKYPNLSRLRAGAST